MKKTFKKYYVKRNPSTLRLMEKDGEPVLGEFIREARIPQDIADEINSNWKNSGVIWVEDEPKMVVSETTEKAEEKEKLWAEIEELLEDGTMKERPHPASGIKKLKEAIERVK